MCDIKTERVHAVILSLNTRAMKNSVNVTTNKEILYNTSDALMTYVLSVMENLLSFLAQLHGRP